MRMLSSIGALMIIAALAASVTAQTLSGDALVAALRRGGYVIVLRHASSPTQPPDAATANPDNKAHERQLDAQGVAGALAMGEAFRRLGIPVGQVMTSPTYRAVETVRLAGWQMWTTVPELGDRGRSMQAISDADAGVLRNAGKTWAPRPGTNTIVVTHQPNIARAFPDIHDLTDGEALVFEPRGDMMHLVGRVKIDEWPHFR